MSLIAAYDIGGTKTELSLFQFQSEFNYKKIATNRFPTNRHQGIEKVLEQLNHQTQEMLKSEIVEVSSIDGVGIGLPGAVDPVERHQIMGNTAIFNHVDLKGSLRKTFHNDCPIQIANDANCFALAEAVCGAGKDLATAANSIVIGIILGTGVGGGIIINKQMMEGHYGGGAEIGHTLFSTDAPMCYCGQKGCVEQVLSGPAFEGMFNARRYSQVPEFQSSREIFRLAEMLDPVAIACINEYKQNLATFLTQLTNMLDPAAIVLGGGMSKEEILYSGLEELVAAKRFVPTQAPRIVQNKLGDSAGIVGAALIAYQSLNS